VRNPLRVRGTGKAAILSMVVTRSCAYLPVPWSRRAGVRQGPDKGDDLFLHDRRQRQPDGHAYFLVEQVLKLGWVG
jgi:hypothetical protein